MQRLILFLKVLGSLMAAGISLQACNEAADKTANENTTASENSLTNSPVDQTLAVYYDLSEAFVNWDSATIKTKAAALRERFEMVKSDTTLAEQARTAIASFEKEAATIEQKNDITQQRRAFHLLSQNFYTWLNQNKYKGSSVYLQECPMAFNDDEIGLWLSRREEIRNPFLGLHHPKYKSGMLECGTVKDSIQRSPE